MAARVLSFSDQRRAGEVYRLQFPSWAANGYDRVSGQVAEDFSVRFLKDGVAVTPTFTIAEVGVLGFYTLAVAAGLTAGTWLINIQTVQNDLIIAQILVHSHDVDSLAGIAGGQIMTLTLRDTANGNAAVPSVRVSVFDDAGTTLVTYGTTNGSGQVTFLLDPGSYTLRAYRPGFSFATQDLTVDADGGTANYDGESVTIEAPADPTLCRLYADFVNFDGEGVEGFRVQVTNLYDPAGDLSVIEKVKESATDEDGHVEIDVVRGLRISVSLVGTSFRREITVPDAESANLLTVLGAASDAFTIVS